MDPPDSWPVSRRTALSAGGVSLLGALGVGSLAFSTATAQPTEIDECTVIDEDGEYVLVDDLEATDDHCLVVTPDATVTIDGNGHTISGPDDHHGIHFEQGGAGRSHEIHDLTITGFELGVRGDDDDHVTLQHVTIDSCTGNATQGIIATTFELVNCTITNNGGYATSRSEELTALVRDSTISSNAGGVVVGFYGEIEDSVIEANDEFGVDISQVGGGGISADRMHIRHNTISDNDRGLWIREADPIVERNDITGNRIGIAMDASPRDVPFAAEGADINYNNIIDNDEYGLIDELQDEDWEWDVDATCNWWGDASGPQHPDNPEPDPQGDPIDGDAAFIPWSVVEVDDAFDPEQHCVGGIDDPAEVLYWQVDFGAGSDPPIPPRYYPDDGVFALGNSNAGVTGNPSHARQSAAGQLGDVEIHDGAFSFDDPENPTTVTVEFTVLDGAPERALHLALFELPGPFREDEIDEQELVTVDSDTFAGGDTGSLTVSVPDP